MTISRDTWLYKPTSDERVPYATQGYMRSRFRNHVHSLLLRELKKSGLTQAQLARRAGKRPDIVCRLIGTPANIELNTLSDLLFAMGGGEPRMAVAYPLEAPPRNSQRPEWLKEKADSVPPTEFEETPPSTSSPVKFFEREPVPA